MLLQREAYDFSDGQCLMKRLQSLWAYIVECFKVLLIESTLPSTFAIIVTELYSNVCYQRACKLVLALLSCHILSAISYKRIQRDRNYSLEQMIPFAKKFQWERRMTVKIARVIASFFICWIPITLHSLGEAITRNSLFFEDAFSTSLPEDLLYLAGCIRRFVFFLLILNSLIDPLIYMH
jgi:ABC-type Fe3+ transport system permease subunit